MIKTVLAVEHPQLKPYHRSVLNKLAAFADGKTGKHARPTFAFLKSGEKWTEQWVGKIIKQLITLGLIECTCPATGPGVASEYRIILTNPAFPESYPTYKELSTQTPEFGCLERADVNTQTGVGEHPNSSASTPKLLAANTQTPQVVPSTPPSKPPSTPPSPKKPATVAVPMPEGWEGLSPIAEMGAPSKQDRKRLETLAAPYGEHAWELLRAFMRHWQDARPMGMSNLRDPWLFFFRECSASRLKNFVENNAGSELRSKVDPQFVKERDEAEEQFRQHHIEMWGLDEKPDDSDDKALDEFLGAEPVPPESSIGG